MVDPETPEADGGSTDLGRVVAAMRDASVARIEVLSKLPTAPRVVSEVVPGWFLGRVKDGRIVTGPRRT